MRRIVTARQQAEMLAPWRTAAVDPTEYGIDPEDYHFRRELGRWKPKVGDDGMVDLYHRTSPERADSIVAHGFDAALSGDPHHRSTDEVFFTTHPHGNQGNRYGDAIIHARVPVGDIDFDTVWGEDSEEAWATVFPPDLKGVPIRRLSASWRTADAAAQNRARLIMEDRWREETTSPKDLRKQHVKKIKNDPYDNGYEWSTRPQKGKDDIIETGPEHLSQDTLPGMNKIRGESTRLWRGVPVDMSDPAFHKVWQMTFGQGQRVSDPGLFAENGETPDWLRYEDRGGKFDHPGLADAIMDGFNAKGGVGEHHTTDYDIADNYGWNRGEGSMGYGEWRDGDFLPVLLDSDWNGKGEDYGRAGSGNFAHEHEIMLKHRKAPLDVQQIKIPYSVHDDEDEWQDIGDKTHHTTAALDAGVSLFVL